MFVSLCLKKPSLLPVRGLLRQCTLLKQLKLISNFSSTPAVQDVVAEVTFVNYKGERVTLSGFQGQTLVDVCKLHGLTDILEIDGGGESGPSEIVHNERWTEDIFGSGAQSRHCHVIVPNKWYEKLAAPSLNEKWILDELEPEVRTPTSRLATEIRLTRELNGLTVYVPDPFPSDIP